MYGSYRRLRSSLLIEQLGGGPPGVRLAEAAAAMWVEVVSQ